MSSRPTAAVIVGHRALEAARIDLRWRHEAPLDHRDALADFELADPRSKD
jgi:hypothetical protein